MPRAAERALMRRRLRRQRRVREALLLDLGALVYELHRQGKRAPELLQQKAGELAAVDDEVRGLEEALGDGEGLEGLLGTGIVGSCASCGALLNAGDGFCARCGAPAQVRAEDESRADEDTAEFDAGEDEDEFDVGEEEDELEEDEFDAREEEDEFDAGEDEDELGAGEDEDELGAREDEGDLDAREDEGGESHAPKPASPRDGEGPLA